jgi:hypothetical protein
VLHPADSPSRAAPLAEPRHRPGGCRQQHVEERFDKPGIGHGPLPTLPVTAEATVVSADIPILAHGPPFGDRTSSRVAQKQRESADNQAIPELRDGPENAASRMRQEQGRSRVRASHHGGGRMEGGHENDHRCRRDRTDDHRTTSDSSSGLFARAAWMPDHARMNAGPLPEELLP